MGAFVIRVSQAEIYGGGESVGDYEDGCTREASGGLNEGGYDY